MWPGGSLVEICLIKLHKLDHRIASILWRRFPMKAFNSWNQVSNHSILNEHLVKVFTPKILVDDLNEIGFVKIFRKLVSVGIQTFENWPSWKLAQLTYKSTSIIIGVLWSSESDGHPKVWWSFASVHQQPKCTPTTSNNNQNATIKPKMICWTPPQIRSKTILQIRCFVSAWKSILLPPHASALARRAHLETIFWKLVNWWSGKILQGILQ